MTTPGGQLTPGDEPEIGDPPKFGVPDSAYVGDAGSPQSFKDLNSLDRAKAEARMRAPLEGMLQGQISGVAALIGGILTTVGAVVQGAVDLVVGSVVAVVEGIGAIFNAVGSLFGMSSRDMSAVDQARVDAENAIVENMSESLEHLDEIQRFGGAYMDYETFSIWEGEIVVRVTPLSAAVPLSAGTGWIPPRQPLTHSALHQYGRAESESVLARGSGQLELLESGLWIIFFQGSYRQGSAYSHRPINMWCHVTPADSPWLPVGPPGLTANGDAIPGLQMAIRRDTGVSTSSFSQGNIAGFGRAAAYSTSQQVSVGGGNTLFGMTYAYLETGGWKVSISDMSFEKFGGASSTFVVAQKMNSETLRDDIENLKSQIAAALPGHNVPLDLNEASIQAMVSQAGDIDVPPVVVPDE